METVDLPKFPHGGKTKWRLSHVKRKGRKIVRNLLFDISMVNMCIAQLYDVGHTLALMNTNCDQELFCSRMNIEYVRGSPI